MATLDTSIHICRTTPFLSIHLLLTATQASPKLIVIKYVKHHCREHAWLVQNYLIYLSSLPHASYRGIAPCSIALVCDMFRRCVRRR
jgi:hypothetical protein